jgi:hypothetical protein
LISGLWSENYKSLTMNVTYEVLVNLWIRILWTGRQHPRSIVTIHKF